MKKILIIGFFAMLGLQACKKSNSLVDGQKPEDRNRESLEAFRKTLTENANGWKAFLYSNNIVGGYGFYLNFKDDGRVMMQADFNEDSARDSLESSYEVKQGMVPSLIFNTYSYLHLLSDPDPGKFGGNRGSGYGSDFEFEIRTQVGDTLKLEGKKRNAKLILVKATAAEKAFYTSGGYQTSLKNFSSYLAGNSILYIADAKDANKKIGITVTTDVRDRSITLSALVNNEIVSDLTTFGFSSSGLFFTKPLVFADRTFVAAEFEDAALKLFLITSTGTKVEVLNSGLPIFPLHLLMGVNYRSINVPMVTNYPGWSGDFASRRAQSAAIIRTFNIRGENLSLGAMRFEFNHTRKTLNVAATLRFGGSSIVVNYAYNYTKTAEGVFKFTAIPPTGGNERALSRSFNPILTERLNVDAFTLDYFVNPVTGKVLGQFKSVEHPDFAFSGEL